VSTPAGVKEEFMKLFKQDVEFRLAVLAEIVQSQEVQDLLRTEREEAQRHLQSELKQFKETILSEMISSCCTLFQQQVQLPPPCLYTQTFFAHSRAMLTTSTIHQPGAALAASGSEDMKTVEEAAVEENDKKDQEQEKEAALVENGEEMKPKPKLHLPDFG
jgi:hypothetical protein